MFVSKSKKFAFAHLPKTGGTSVHLALRPYLDYINDESLRHCSWDTFFYMDHDEDIDSYFKITSVRNPWSWLVSTYLMVLKSPNTPDYDLVCRMSFEEYAQYYFKSGAFFFRNYLFDTRKPSQPWMPDFILRFEHLDYDFRVLCDKLGLQAELDHFNESSISYHYSGFYTDATKDFVYEQMRDEIELLGYEFDRRDKFSDYSQTLNNYIIAQKNWHDGVEALDRHDWEFARQCFETAIELWPGDPRFYRQISYAYGVLGMRQEAISAAEKAIELNPNNFDYRMQLENLKEQ